MKRIILLIVISILLTACNNKADNRQIEELTDKFTYTTGKCLVDECLVTFTNLKRGELVDIKGEDDTYYYINKNGIELAVEKEYIRISDNGFKPYTAYTYAGTNLVDNIFDQNKIDSYSLNDEIEVIDEYGKWAIIETDDGYGYILLSGISKYYIKKIEPVVPEYPTDNGGGGDSGGGSSSGGGGSSAPSEEPAAPTVDGEDMELAVYDSSIKLLAANEFKPYVIVDNVITYLSKLNRNDVVKVINSDDDYSEILINGRKAKVESIYIRLDSEVEFLTFEIYTNKYAKIYSDFKLSNEIHSCSLNDEYKVLDEIEGVYVVELLNGYGYIAKSQTSKSKIVEYVAPKIEQSSDYSSEGSSSGGGGSSSEPSAPEPSEPMEWTDPVL